MNMKTIAIIPSRYASSRFPGKPLADILGKCMVQRVYEQARKAFDSVCVATDDDRIYDKVISFGGEAVMTSSSHQSGTDRCYEAYNNYLTAHPGITFDLVMNIQGDEPLIDPSQLKALEKAFEDSSVYLGTMAKLISDTDELFSKNTPKVILDNQGYALYFSRNTIPFLRGIPEGEWLSEYPYLKHIGLYAYRPEILKKICSLERSSLETAESLEQLRWLENGLKIKVVKTDCTTFAIDTPDDLETVLKILLKTGK